MSDDTGKPQARSVIRSATQRMEDVTRAPYVKGLPEWEMFPDETSRQAAIKEIERGMTPRSIKDALGFLIAVIIFLGVPLVISYLIATYMLPMMGRWNDRIFWGMTLVGYVVVVYFALRRDMPKALRKQLIKCGVPVCMKCGYDLRGLPADRTHCPECGRAFDEPVVRLVRRGEAQDIAMPSATTDDPR